MKTTTLFILLLVSSLVKAQFQEIKSPTIEFDKLEVKFNGIVILTDSTTNHEKKESINVFLDLGETVQDVLIEVTKSELSQINIEQQYQTSISITNEGPHLDLLKWKHYTSKWENLEIKKDNKSFLSLAYSKEEEEKFPSFKLTELIDYVNSLGLENYADLVENPTYEDGSKHWWIGLSKVSFRISGIDIESNRITRQINFIIPMGC